VNRSFLLEMRPGGGCNDPALLEAIRKLMRAVASSDGAAMQELVSPVRGLQVRHSATSPPVRFRPNQAGGLFTSTASLSWGHDDDGTGAPISGSFQQLILPPFREDVASKGAQEKCGELLMGGGAGIYSWPADLAGLTPVSFHRPGERGHDWHSSVAGFEYVDGKPYLAALVQYRWEI
jgi:hypothetical protein